MRFRYRFSFIKKIDDDANKGLITYVYGHWDYIDTLIDNPFNLVFVSNEPKLLSH